MGLGCPWFGLGAILWAAGVPDQVTLFIFTQLRGGGTVHPAIPDLRRTYGSVYARFDAGFTFRFRWVRVRFRWDPYRTSTDFRIRTGFRTQKVE